MLRLLAPVLAVTALAAASAADACSCMPYATRAEADAAGERVYRSADLIVEATAGAEPTTRRKVCYAKGNKPDPAWVGRRITNDRPLTIHRVIKGRPSGTVMLFERDLDVHADYCSASVTSCDVDVASGRRMIFVLHRVAGNRYRMESYCSLMALRASARGRALFGEAPGRT